MTKINQLCGNLLTTTSLLLVLSEWATNSRALGQIIPDATLPNNSVVTPSGNTFTIDGGTAAGSNLFHSFGQFSLGTGNTAYFNNASNIANIITRVTGGQVSNIDGLIRANGEANLFLINPSGIVFGQNARLDIKGSFIGSTASSVKFADGKEFSATNPQTPPLLTISVPMGLQFNQPPGSIQVQGTGHALEQPNQFAPIVNTGSGSEGLQVKPGKTLALVGGELLLQGGTLSAQDGRIELGSVRSGVVNLQPHSSGFALNYESNANLSDISLRSRSLVETSGNSGGSIQIQGRNIALRDSSVILLENNGAQPDESSLQLHAAESVSIQGQTSETTPMSGLYNQNFATGAGSNIAIVAKELLIEDGGLIDTRSYSIGKAGDITVEAERRLYLNGFPFTATRTSPTGAIRSFAVGKGDAGNITLSTTQLSAVDGGGIASIAIGAIDTDQGVGTRQGGNVTVYGSEFIELRGVNPFIAASSALVASSIEGNAGQVTVKTPRLLLKDGAVISSSSHSTGNAGSISINASESVEVGGVSPDGVVTQIISAAQELDPLFAQSLGLELKLSGASGNITINTPVLKVTDGARVNVRNDGPGKAGDLTIHSNSFILNGGASITAATASGEGGNINLKMGDYVLLRNGSQITAQARGQGNGGNITIDSPFVVALKPENSDIIANAVAGKGGNININATGIYGLVPTKGALNDSITEINASSQFGVSGTVILNSPEVDTTSAAVKLPEQVTDASNQVVVGCAAARGNSFTVTGRGGIPEDPTTAIRGETLWSDLQDFIADGEQAENLPAKSVSNANTTPRSRLVEATSWRINEQGQVELVADLPKDAIARQPECKDLTR